ncbi:MAG TPA: FtsX-like permease family protein [Aquihabitans sp.]|jgi:putative ABC transport system permease protein|nr:FtsX-like permease family protein [Aquihabitans sp.]
MFRTTLRSLWSHKRRLISTCVAVVLGVAFMSGTLVLNSTIGRIFDDLFADLGEGIDAQVRGQELFESQAGGGTQRALLDDDVVAKVEGIDGVAAAEGSIQSVQLTVLDAKGDPMGGNGPPTIVGSWDTDEGLASYQVAEGRAPTAPGEVIIDRAGVDKGEFDIGDEVTIITAEGREQLRLVGISRFGEADSAGGAIFVGTTLPEAQRLTGEPGMLNTVNARAEEGVSPEQLVRTIRESSVAPDVDVVTGKQASEEASSDIKEGFSFFTVILLVFAGIALFVGAFIISNTFGILVAQRTRELALLRAIGASRRQVMGSVLLEAGLIGLFSAVVGFLVGVALAVGAFELLKSFGLELPGADLVIEPITAVQTIVVGLLITAVAAVLPAIRATRVAPIAALRDVAVDTSGSSKLRAAFGALLFVVGVILVLPAFGEDVSSDKLPSIGGGLGLIMVSVLVAGPVLARPLARGIGAGLPIIKGVTGRIARENAMRSPRRTASTASALIIGVALVAFISVFATSAQASINSAIGTGFEGDYIIQPANQFSFTGAPPSVAEELRDVEGVRGVTAITFTEGQIALPNGEKPGSFIGGIDPETVGGIFQFEMAEGSISDLQPGGMLIDKVIAKERDLAVGDELSVLSGSGRTAEFTVAGISDDPALLGQWTIDRRDTEKLTPNPTDFLLGITLDEGVSPESVRGELRDVVEPYPNMKLQDRDQYTSSIVGSITALLNVIYALLAVSIIIALIGIANTLSLSIHERTRELGLLRAMGMTRGQLRSSVRWEAVIVALMGTAIGIILGLGLSYIMVRALESQGVNEFDVNVSGMIVVVLFGAGLGVLASVRPARRAAKLNVLQAIGTE